MQSLKIDWTTVVNSKTVKWLAVLAVSYILMFVLKYTEANAQEQAQQLIDLLWNILFPVAGVATVGAFYGRAYAEGPLTKTQSSNKTEENK